MEARTEKDVMARGDSVDESGDVLLSCARVCFD